MTRHKFKFSASKIFNEKDREIIYGTYTCQVCDSKIMGTYKTYDEPQDSERSRIFNSDCDLALIKRIQNS